jgi:hypothetical protein
MADPVEGMLSGVGNFGQRGGEARAASVILAMTPIQSL